MELYDIEPKEFFVTDKIVDGDDILYKLLPVSRVAICPCCFSPDIKGHGSAERQIRDVSSFGKRVGLLISARRYICKSCKATFNDTFESIDDDSKITNRLRDYIREESLRRPFLNIADELGVSDTTVRNIFKDYAKELESARVIKTPRVLGVDENHICNQYRAVFVDIEEKKLLEMLTNRKKPNIIKYIKSLPNYEKIDCVVCDMYVGYREAAYECIPGVTVVIDKFHVIKMVNDALEKIRRKLRADIGKDESRKLRRSRGLLLANSELLTYEQAIALKEVFEVYPIFEKPYQLKETFRDIYASSSREEAEKQFIKWESDVAGFPEFETVAATVNNWHKEIFSYFDYPYTNATTESLNKLINDIANKGRGYSFEVLRLKCLFGTKATKREKYDFHKYKKYRNGGLENTMAMFTFTTTIAQSYDVIEKKELVSGWGVDIDELDYYVRTEF